MRPIKLTPQTIQTIQQAFNNNLENLRLQGDVLNFSYNLNTDFKKTIPQNIQKPDIYISAVIYLKMLEFVLLCNKEIAWHGTVERRENHFFIKDVFLYPQKISAATVQTDTTEYTQWAEKLPETTFNTMRFQGHSHVNMSTSPSATDLANWNEFLQNLLDNDFYIFAIINKSQELNIRIYDLANNILFDKDDINIHILFDKTTELNTIKEDMTKYIKEPAPVANSVYNNFGTQDNYWDQFRNDYSETDYDRSYANNFKTTKPTLKPKTKLKMKQHVVIMNREGRNFEKEYPEYDGERANIKQNGISYEVFIPYEPLGNIDILNLRKDGWHVREMVIPEEI